MGTKDKGKQKAEEFLQSEDSNGTSYSEQYEDSGSEDYDSSGSLHLLECKKFKNESECNKGKTEECKTAICLEPSFHILPHVPLKNIYKYLPAMDLINAQYVCKHWNNVAQDVEVWKDKVLKLEWNGVKSFVEALKKAPLLRKIDTHIFNDSFQWLSCMETLKDIRSYKCGKVKHDKLKQLVGKYPYLEDINLEITDAESGDVLETLTGCRNLRTINVTLHVTEFSKRNTVQLLGNSFHSLRNLNLAKLNPSDIFQHEDLMYILEKKKEQLEKLKFRYNESTKPEILILLSKCTNLKLRLKIEKTSDLDLIVLQDLKSLEINIPWLDVEDLKYFEAMLTENIRMKNVKSVKICSIKCEAANIIKKIIYSFPNLNHLELSYFFVNVIEEQFFDIKGLKKLKALFISSCHLTQFELTHVTKLRSLEEFVLLCSTKLIQVSYKSIAQLSELRCLTLHECICPASDVELLLSSLTHLKTLNLSLCFVKDHKKYSIQEVKSIRLVCKERNIEVHRPIHLQPQLVEGVLMRTYFECMYTDVHNSCKLGEESSQRHNLRHIEKLLRVPGIF